MNALTETAPVTETQVGICPRTDAHHCRATERTAGSKCRRQMLATILYLASLTGHSDGSTYAVCVGCGENAYVGGNPRSVDTLNMGHVLSDAEGGAYCVANMLPLCRQCNIDMGKENLTDVLIPIYDNRDQWNGRMLKDPGMVKEAPAANRGRASWNRPTAL